MKVLREHRFPEAIVKVVGSFHDSMEMKVRYEGEVSSNFEVEGGVRLSWRRTAFRVLGAAVRSERVQVFSRSEYAFRRSAERVKTDYLHQDYYQVVAWGINKHRGTHVSWRGSEFSMPMLVDFVRSW